MKKLTDLFDRIVPRYAILPIAAALITNFGVYIGCRLIVGNRTHYDFSCVIDDMIPFCSFFVVFYVLAYAQWVISYLLIAQAGKKACYYLCGADVIAKLICALFFIIVPTMIVRPDITGTGLLDRLTALIYRVDAADNLFPSIHCLESWLCYRSIKWLKVPSWYKPLTIFITLGVFASTVFLKQHVFVDIIGGILVLEIGMLIMNRVYKRKRRSL